MLACTISLFSHPPASNTGSFGPTTLGRRCQCFRMCCCCQAGTCLPARTARRLPLMPRPCPCHATVYIVICVVSLCAALLVCAMRRPDQSLLPRGPPVSVQPMIAAAGTHLASANNKEQGEQSQPRPRPVTASPEQSKRGLLCWCRCGAVAARAGGGAGAGWHFHGWLSAH